MILKRRSKYFYILAHSRADLAHVQIYYENHSNASKILLDPDVSNIQFKDQILNLPKW